jgi:magnesium transporter
MPDSRAAGTRVPAASSTSAPAVNPQPAAQVPPSGNKPKRKKKSGKKRKHRRQSFIAAEDTASAADSDRPTLEETQASQSSARDSIYRLGRHNKSSESLESEALLDHRASNPLQARRQSLQQGLWGSSSQTQSRYSLSKLGRNGSNSRLSRTISGPQLEGGSGPEDVNDNTPLLSGPNWRDTGFRNNAYGTGASPSLAARFAGVLRRPSRASSVSSPGPSSDLLQSREQFDDYDVNNPPSVPGSPLIDAAREYADTAFLEQNNGETIIDIDRTQDEITEVPSTPIVPGTLRTRMTLPAEEDVCFPQDILSEIAEEDEKRELGRESVRSHRRRRKPWPDIEMLEAWRREEKEEVSFDEIRAQRINEPLLVDGRLRPRKVAWHHQVDNAPYRFTYFNEEFESTIHSHTISELVQPGQSFEDLFIPKPPIISDSSSDEEETSRTNTLTGNEIDRKISVNSFGQAALFKSDTLRSPFSKSQNGQSHPMDYFNGGATHSNVQSPPNGKSVRHGPRPVFWLDVLQPTESEMRILSKAFGIHPLTTEDIMTQEAREKVELFRNYYFVIYRSFEQDIHREDYLEPVNMYVVVFREGILSVSHSPLSTTLSNPLTSIVPLLPNTTSSKCAKKDPSTFRLLILNY